jgi:hypothetical protein
MGGVARAAEACSLGGRGEAPAAQAGVLRTPGPQVTSLMERGNLRPVRRLDCPAARMQRSQTPARSPVHGGWLESLMVTPPIAGQAHLWLRLADTSVSRSVRWLELGGGPRQGSGNRAAAQSG